MAFTGKPARSPTACCKAQLQCYPIKENISLSSMRQANKRVCVSGKKGSGVSQEKALGNQVGRLRVRATHWLNNTPQVASPSCKLGIREVCCENQMRSCINTLAPYVTHSKCSRNMSYNRNVGYKTNMSSKGQWRRVLPFEEGSQ